MYKLTYKLTPEQTRAFGLLDSEANTSKTILLDTIDDTEVTTDSTITTHPQLDGQSVADHMYRNPAEVTITGAFGAFGGMSTSVSNVGVGSILQQLQSTFELLKDYGVICSLTKVAREGSKSAVRFKVRRNMVLQSIAWTESITTLKFTFKFVEVMTAKIQEYSVNTMDSFLPSIDVLQSISFTQEVLDWSAILQLVIAVAVDSGWVDQRIVAEAFKTTGLYTALGVGVGLGIGLTGSSLAASLAAAGLSSGVVPVAGWIIAGVAALGILGYGIYSAIKSANLAKTFKEKQIKWTNDDIQNKKNVERFNNFVSDISKQIVKLDNSISAYSMTITKPCEFYVNFENNYYLCKIANSPLKLNFCDIDGNSLGKSKQLSTCMADFSNYSSSNAIYRLPYTGSYVYLLRKYNYETTNGTTTHSFSGGGRGMDSGESTSRTITIKFGLPTDTYYLIASKIAPEDFTAVIENIIKNAIMR